MYYAFNAHNIYITEFFFITKHAMMNFMKFFKEGWSVLQEVLL